MLTYKFLIMILAGTRGFEALSLLNVIDCDVFQCWCRENRNLHRHRQHVAADPGPGYSECSGFLKTCANTEELPGADRGK